MTRDERTFWVPGSKTTSTRLIGFRMERRVSVAWLHGRPDL
jgi:hypothetical protein